MKVNFSGFTRSRVLAATAVVVLVVGFAGHLSRNFSQVDAGSASQAAKLIFDSLLQSLQLFTLSNRPDPGADNWALVLARLGGALVAFGTVGRVLIALYARSRDRAKRSALKGHTLLCGYGERGRFFAKSASSSQVIAVDTTPSIGSEQSEGNSILRLRGNAEDPAILQEAGISRCDYVVIGTGSDERNLGIALTALQSLTSLRSTPLAMIVTIDDLQLVDSIEREDAILKPAGSRRTVEVKLFNLAREAAVELIQRALWAKIAIEKGQDAIRLTVVGGSDAAVEVVLQFLRTSPCAGLGRPRIDWYAPMQLTRANLLARLPSFAGTLGPIGDDPTRALLHWAIDLRLHDVDVQSESAKGLFANWNEAEVATAIVVATTNGVSNIRVARSVRREMQRQSLALCPIHVYTPTGTSLDPLLARLPLPSGTDAPSQVSKFKDAESVDLAIEPFGRLEYLCKPANHLSARDVMAKRFHDAYRTRRNAEQASSGKQPSADRDESVANWADLKETYRRSNRRAADHLPVKWLAANHIAGQPLQNPYFPQPMSDNMLEKLAEMEHGSWRIDRELDGWRYAPVRNNARMHHPDLVPYDQLPEATKEYDRNQIREIWGSRLE